MNLPKVLLTGGPHAKDTKLLVNGEEVPGVTRVEIVLDVNDVIRIKTYQIGEVVFEGEALVEDAGFHITVKMIEPPGEDYVRRWLDVAVGTGVTVPQALRDAANNMEERARRGN